MFRDLILRRRSEKTASESTDDISDSSEEHAELPNIGLEEDMFGVLACSLMRDFYYVNISKRIPVARLFRLCTTLLLVLSCIATQVLLLLWSKDLVLAQDVHDIRIAYDHYERHMYNATYLSVNGKARGVDGHFMPDKFPTLPAADQAHACRIPLSQPSFTFCVLFLWTLLCIKNIKECLKSFWLTVVSMPGCASMGDAKGKPEHQHSDRSLGTSTNDPRENHEHAFVIVALPLSFKVLFTVLAIVPHLLITVFVLWLGCRWLVSTINFTDMVINTMELKFVLILKELLYKTLVPYRSKMDVNHTFIYRRRKDPASFQAFTLTALWLIVAVVWVLAYMGIPNYFNGWQMVLPDYKWDLHDVCAPWITWRYCVTPPCPASPFNASNESRAAPLHV